MGNSSWVGSQKSISVTVVGAIQNIRGGRSVTHDPPIAKKGKNESIWITLFIFHSVRMLRFDFAQPNGGGKNLIKGMLYLNLNH